MAVDPSRITDRLAQLETQRRPHERIWSDCFDHSFPVRGSGLVGDVYDADRVQRKKADLVDDTATDAAQILASSLMGGMTPANARWFELDVESADAGGKQWLDDAAQAIWSEIHRSNFDAAGLEANLDIVGAGWAVLYIGNRFEDGVGEDDELYFDCWPLSQCYVAASKPAGAVDTVFRKFSKTAEQVVEEFGQDASEQTREAAKKQPDQKVELVRAIFPRSAWVPGSSFARSMPWASVTLEVKAKKVLRESGYPEFPCVVPRWRLIPASHYAIGPMLDALPTARRLNAIARMELAAMDLAVAGMWIAENDGVLNAATVKIGPRKIIVANSVDSMKELKSGSDFNASFSKSEQLQAQIRKILMADQLQPQDGPAMTATEVHARMALIRQLLGPVFGRLQSEYLQPLVYRCFRLMSRRGAFDFPPQSIAGRNMAVQYVSPLARAQRLHDVSAMDQYETVLIQQATVDAAALDVYDWDAARRERADLMGVPQKLLRKERDVEDIRDDRAQQQAQMQQQAMAAHAATTMIDAAGKRMAAA